MAVVGILLTNNMLNGTLPACLGNMTGLLALCVRKCLLARMSGAELPRAETLATTSSQAKYQMSLERWAATLRRRKYLRRRRRHNRRRCQQAFLLSRRLLSLPKHRARRRSRQAGSLR